MEVVSAVASIAGIAAFTGQTINGLQKLYKFFDDCRNASKTADRFLREVTSLTEALKDVETFLAKAQSLSDALRGTDLASLSINVEDCSKDVIAWVKEAEGMSSSLLGTNHRFRKFVAAVKKQGVRDVFEQIGSHKSTIMLSLSATGRLLDAYNCSQSDVLVSKVGEATSYGKVTVEALSRLESMMEAPRSYEQDALRTSKSLSSIASAVSRIESLFSRQFRASPPPPTLPPGPGRRILTPRSPRRMTDAYNSKFPFISGSQPSIPGPHKDIFDPPQSSMEFSTAEGTYKIPVDAPPGTRYRILTPRSPRGATGTYSDELYNPKFQFTSGSQPSIPGPHKDIFDPPQSSMEFSTAQGACTMPVDVQEAARLAEEKRLRNASASQRFRQRRREKENEVAATIEKLQRRVQEGNRMRDFYHAERNRYRDFYRNLETRSADLQDPPSPRLGSASPLLRPGEQIGRPSPTFGGLMPASIREYMMLSLNTQHSKANLRMLSVLVENLDSTDPELEDSYVNAKEQLAKEMDRLRQCRFSNWNAGHDLDGLDRMMELQVETNEDASNISFERYTPSERQSKPWWDVLHHTISQGWITKTDRINSWLLQNLAALPEEANRHRMLIPDGEQLGEEQWARLVLKFWPLDEAAPRFELGTCSTNGAVDSAGACHSARVLLYEMPFHVGSEDAVMEDPLPIRRKRGAVSEGNGSDILTAAKRRRIEKESESP